MSRPLATRSRSFIYSLPTKAINRDLLLPSQPYWEGGTKSLARPSTGMELQLGPNVTQIHLYKARSLCLGAHKHRIYTYIPLFQIQFLENILTRIYLQYIRFEKYIRKSVARSSKRCKKRIIHNLLRVCKSQQICLTFSLIATF